MAHPNLCLSLFLETDFVQQSTSIQVQGTCWASKCVGWRKAYLKSQTGKSRPCSFSPFSDWCGSLREVILSHELNTDLLLGCSATWLSSLPRPLCVPPHLHAGWRPTHAPYRIVFIFRLWSHGVIQGFCATSCHLGSDCPSHCVLSYFLCGELSCHLELEGPF